MLAGAVTVLGAAQVAPEEAAVTVVEWVETELEPETGATVPEAALVEALVDELEPETGATVLAALLEALVAELEPETGATVPEALVEALVAELAGATVLDAALVEALVDELAGATVPDAVLLEALVDELDPETGATVPEALEDLAVPVVDARVEAGVVAGAQAPEAPPIKLE